MQYFLEEIGPDIENIKANLNSKKKKIIDEDVCKG